MDRYMKNLKKSLLLISAIVALTVLATPVWATVWWEPGAEGSTYQKWSFDDDTNPASPLDENPFGTAIATITTDVGWESDLFGRQGVWSGVELDISMDIPNRQEQFPYKEIWVDVIYHNTGLDYAEVSPAYSTQPGSIAISPLGSTSSQLANGWTLIHMGWRIEPNPDSELISLGFTDAGGAGLDSVVVYGVDSVEVYTICIPEPATMCLLGLGGLILLRKKT